jgi:ATP-dependent helicase/nuclease subunit A
VHYAADPRDPDIWRAFGSGDAPPVPAAERLALRDRLLAVPVPATAAGAPNANWVTAMQAFARCVDAADWPGVVGHGVARAVLNGRTYYRAEVPGDVEALVQQALLMARSELETRFARQSLALGSFVSALASVLEEQQRDAALYGFDDITRTLARGTDAEGTMLTGSDSLYYRLDGQVRHLLLDEFQDTSLTQWLALQPLVDEVFGSGEGSRAGVIVADPKQSIYGWRGGAPELVDEVLRRYAPAAETLATSWRSSPVVLEVVNTTFGLLPGLPIWQDMDEAGDVVAGWMRSFTPHTAQHGSLPGHVRIVAGPLDEGSGQDRPRLCRRAAELVAELHAGMPGRSIGVLTRRNATVAQMMMELKRAGVHASEEGGNAVSDNAAVTSILALLRLADHPGNRIARYHVARTPVGAAMGFTDHDDDAAAHQLARHVRRRLLQDGYGAFLSGLATRISPSCDAREARRTGQLVELAFRYDDVATLRPSDFVRWIALQRVEDPSSADVRVMTIHQSKGLEFDIVVLPELDAPLLGTGAPPVLAYRAAPVAPVTRAFPYVSASLMPLFSHIPELAAAARQGRASGLRDALSSLYVAMTRARHALHVVVRPDGPNGPSTAKTGARILREALGAPDGAVEEGTVIFEDGEPRWHHHVPLREQLAHAAGGEAPLPALAVRAQRSRALPRRSPSQLEGGSRVDLANVLRLGAAAPRLRGSIVHIWFEQVGWLEDGTPADDALLRLVRGIAPDMDTAELAELAGRFRAWIGDGALSALLSRSGYSGDAAVECEVPFLRRDGDVLLEGVIDRLVTIRDNGQVVSAHIVDWKTDAVAPGSGLDERVDHYRPQVDAYRRAVAAMHRIPPDKVSAHLVFLEAGAIVPL